MIDLLLIAGVVIGGILSLVGFVCYVTMGYNADTHPEIVIPPIVLAICAIWLVIACNVEIEYETKTCPITTINGNTQVADVDGELINVNNLFGKIAKPNEALEVKKIKNHFRGWVYFIMDEAKYKLVGKE